MAPIDETSLFFDEIAEDYDLISRQNVEIINGKRDYLNAYKAGVAKKIAKSSIKVLDYGCGIGMSIPHLKNNFPNAEITAYDPSPKSTEVLSKLYPEINIFSNQDELMKGKYDLVFVSCVIHHIRVKDLDHELKRMISLLKKGGSLVIFEHNPLNPLTQIVVANSPIDKDAVLIRKSELIARIAAIKPSLEIKSAYSVFFPDILNWCRPLEETLLKHIPLGAQYYIQAKNQTVCNTNRPNL